MREEHPLRALTNAIDRFCYRHPHFGIPNLMLYILIGNVLVYVLDLVSNGTCSAMLYFSRYAIFHGEVWRLITFLFVPSTTSMLSFVLSLFLYYFIGRALENLWGPGRFTFYYLLGVIFNLLFGLVVGYTTNYYLNMSLFFAFATLYPDTQFLLIIIPVKAKWLAWIDLAFFAIEMITGTFPYNMLPLVAMLNYLVFFGEDLYNWLMQKLGRPGRTHRKNTMNFKKETKRIRKEGYLHKCAVCGRTDADYPDLEFRYCSKCKGYYCYCMDHINSHVHITD
jgi:membrane associated rhomboid family serine protease